MYICLLFCLGKSSIHGSADIYQVVDEEMYVTSLKTDRQGQLQEFCMKLEENSSTEICQKLVLEEEVQTNLNLILSADDKRRAAAQLAIDEYQQGVAVSFCNSLTFYTMICCCFVFYDAFLTGKMGPCLSDVG